MQTVKSVRKDTTVVGLKWAQWPGKGTAWKCLQICYLVPMSRLSTCLVGLKIRALLMLGLGFKLELLISVCCLSVFVQTLCKDFSFRLWLCFSQPLKALCIKFDTWVFVLRLLHKQCNFFIWKGQITCTSNKILCFSIDTGAGFTGLRPSKHF